jgi:hypothetical protein
MLVGHRVAIGLRLLSTFSTPELHHLLVLLVNVLSIPQGFRTLRAACLWQSAKHRWLWIKPNKSCSFMKQISILDDKVSGLTARVVHLEECDSFLVGIVESACELLRCKVPCNLPLFPFLLCY